MNRKPLCSLSRLSPEAQISLSEQSSCEPAGTRCLLSAAAPWPLPTKARHHPLPWTTIWVKRSPRPQYPHLTTRPPVAKRPNSQKGLQDREQTPNKNTSSTRRRGNHAERKNRAESCSPLRENP